MFGGWLGSLKCRENWPFERGKLRCCRSPENRVVGLFDMYVRSGKWCQQCGGIQSRRSLRSCTIVDILSAEYFWLKNPNISPDRASCMIWMQQTFSLARKRWEVIPHDAPGAALRFLPRAT